MRFSSESILQTIIEGLRDVFPDVERSVFHPKTTLGEMPEWDSMAGVNLQTYLLQQFEVEVPLELLSDETALEEIVDFLQNPIRSEVA